MNMYDTRTIACVQCGQEIGEIDYDALVIRPICRKCATIMPEEEKILYAVSAIKSRTKELIA